MVILILDCVGEKNQQLIVFPGIFSIKFQCFVCKQITFQCCSIGKLGPKHKNQNHSKDFSYGSFSPAKVYNQRCSSFFSLLGIYMDLEKGLQRENQVEMTFFQCCTEFMISREPWHSCFMRFCRWKRPKSEVNTDHNENLFIKILLGSRQCASSFTTISWWLDFSFLFN